MAMINTVDDLHAAEQKGIVHEVIESEELQGYRGERGSPKNDLDFGALR